MASKFEQYLEILNNKHSRKGSTMPDEPADGSPLKTNHYLKTLGESPHAAESQAAEDPRQPNGSKGQSLYDFSKAELPFNSLQETRERNTLGADGGTTMGTSERGPTIQEYYQLQKRQGHRQDVQLESFQSQLDSLQSTVAMLVERLDNVDQRTYAVESRLEQVLDAHEREAHARPNSQLKKRTSSQLRLDQEAQTFLSERVNNLQVIVERLDGKLNEVREDQMRQNIDPRPLIAEQVESLMQQIDLKYAKKATLTASIDNLGEEIAGDVNSLETQLKYETDRVQSLLEQVATFQSDLKVCQISIAKIPLPIDPNSETANFSETLVKQLLRQGEDRKTSIEETKMLQSKIQEIKLTQKRHRELQLKTQKQLGAHEEDLRRCAHNVDKIRASQHKLNTFQTSFKFNKQEFATKDDLMRLKERINYAFQVLLKLHETNIDRDAVIVESLLQTQLGKLRRLICKRTTHDDLKVFQEELNEDFEAPEILINLKPPAMWRQHDSCNSSQLNQQMRKIKHRRRSQSHKKAARSNSRSTNGSQRRSGAVKLKSRKTAYDRNDSMERQPNGGPYADNSEDEIDEMNFTANVVELSQDQLGQSSIDDLHDQQRHMQDRQRSFGSSTRNHTMAQRRSGGRHASRYNGHARGASRSSRRSYSHGKSDYSKKSSRSEHVRGSTSRDTHSKQRYRRHQKMESQLSSNKDLAPSSTRNGQKYPMFGYQSHNQAHSSQRVVANGKLGDSQRQRKEHLARSKKLQSDKQRAHHSGRRRAKQHQSHDSSQQLGYEHQSRLTEEELPDQHAPLGDRKDAQGSSKKQFNYKNEIQMWGPPISSK